MRQHETTRIWVILALLITTAPLWAATVHAAEDDLSLYRLEFRVTEFKNGDTASAIFYLKARAKWSDKPELENAPAPVQIINQTLSEDQLKAFAEQFKSDTE